MTAVEFEISFPTPALVLAELSETSVAGPTAPGSTCHWRDGHRSTRRPYRSPLTPTSLFQRTPEANSRASSPCSEFEQFQIVPVVETPYLARAGKNEFLNLVPDIEEIRPG